MKPQEIRALSVEEIADKVGNLKKELMHFRFQAKTGKLEQQSVINRTRKDIARLKTIMIEMSKEGVKSVPVRPAAAVKTSAKKEAKK